MILSLVWFIDLILIGICLLLGLSLLFRKLSPQFALFLIFSCLFMYFGIFRPHLIEKKPSIISTSTVSQDSLISKDTLANTDKPKHKKDIDKSSKNKSDNPTTKHKENKTEKTIPKEYEDIDKRLQTYRTKGKWIWDDKFVQIVKKKTGWRKLKTGIHIISVDYKESFDPIDQDRQRKFVYLGGDIEITVNGKSCCNGIVSIPNGISGKNIGSVKKIIQDTITALLLKNETLVIDQIKNCLHSQSN